MRTHYQGRGERDLFCPADGLTAVTLFIFADCHNRATRSCNEEFCSGVRSADILTFGIAQQDQKWASMAPTQKRARGKSGNGA